MPDPGWRDLDEALSAATGRGHRVRVWLRDDDAIDVTPALDRLAALCGAAGLPVLLAVIPEGATPALAGWLDRHPDVTACQHGIAHINHAAPGERACELGGAQSDETVIDALRLGRDRLRALLGPAAPADILVPPWNRIRDSLIPRLAPLGYAALSTFAGRHAAAPLPRLDCDLDIIDWRSGRVGRSETDLCARLVKLVEATAALDGPIGLLTHHLAHDAVAWAFLERFCERMAGDERIIFSDAATELAALGARNDQ